MSRSDPVPAIDQVVVIHDFAYAEGGAGKLAVLAACQYRDRGIPVTFFSGMKGLASDLLTDIECIGLDEQPLLAISTAKALRQGYYNTKARDALACWIAENDTPRTVYHLHNWSQVLSPAIFTALRAVDDRLVVTCHDFFNTCPNGGFAHYGKCNPCELKPLSFACATSQCDRRSGLHKMWRMARQVKLNREARFDQSRATFTFIHEKMKDRFVASGFRARNLLTIQNPVEPWSHERVMAERNSDFIFVGRLSRDKGADLAADAAQMADVPIKLMGTGELEAGIAAMGGKVEMRGWCDSEQLLAAARKARAIVVPSRITEPFGLVILEAAASGIPVIISNRAYLAEDAERLGFGTLVDPSDCGAIAETLKRLADDNALVAAMSESGVKRASSLFLSPAQWSAALEKVFIQKLEGRCGDPDHAMVVPAGQSAVVG